MALTQTRENMRDAVRRFTNTQGTTALLRHPNADLNDYINRGLSRLRYLLTQANPDQRYLSSTSASTSDGTSVYSLPSDFGFLISVDITANGAKTWLTSYEMHERPALTSADQPTSGIPFCYRLRGGNIELLPEPGGAYTYTLWYVPHTTELSADASVLDTVNRLDDYVVAYASRFVATKDKNWDLLNECKALMAELTSEIEVLGRSRDQNAPSRIVDVYQADRWGRRRRA
jgi:hypothetical protein